MSAVKLRDLGVYVRSKNAGPFWITIDIFCGTPELFEKLDGETCLDPEMIAQLFRVESTSIRIFRIRALSVIKISFPRPVPQGHTFDRDQHSGQYFVRLLDVPLGAPRLKEVSHG